MMTKTKEDFCRELLDDESPRETLDPERLAGRFVRYFDAVRPPHDGRAERHAEPGRVRGGVGQEADGRAEGHLTISQPGGGYDIHYRQDLWAGTQHLLRWSTRPTRSSTRPSATWTPATPPDRSVCTGGRALRGGGADAAGGLRAAGPESGGWTC